MTATWFFPLRVLCKWQLEALPGIEVPEDLQQKLGFRPLGRAYAGFLGITPFFPQA
jgi:hypothetical protein